MPKAVKQTARPLKRRRRRVNPRSAWDSTDAIRMNVYGKSGTGKTTLWSTFPGPILALICSGGSKPGELRSIDTPAMREKITATIVENPKQIDQLLEEQRETGFYETVVLDHASSFLRLVLKEILGLNRAPLNLTWGTATQGQWGIINSQMIERLSALLSLSCNVLIVSQERSFNTEKEDEDGVLTPYVASDVTPGVLRWLYPAADYTCQTFIRQKTKEQIVTIKKGGKPKKIRRRVPTKGVDYCLRTAPGPTCMTKFRLPKGTELPDAIVDPSFQKIQALIQGGKLDG